MAYMRGRAAPHIVTALPGCCALEKAVEQNHLQGRQQLFINKLDRPSFLFTP
jgi:hypothetical protein